MTLNKYDEEMEETIEKIWKWMDDRTADGPL